MFAAGIRSPAAQRIPMPQVIAAKPRTRRPKATPSRRRLDLAQAAIATASAARRTIQAIRDGLTRL